MQTAGIRADENTDIARLSPRAIQSASEDNNDVSRPGRALEQSGTSLTTRCQALTCIQRQVSFPIETQARQVFLSSMVVSCKTYEISTGHFTRIGQLIEHATGDDALLYAVEAVALCSYGRRFKRPEVEVQSLARCSAALQRLHKTDFDDRSKTLRVVATIVVLGVYEVSIRDQRAPGAPFFANIHADQAL